MRNKKDKSIQNKCFLTIIVILILLIFKEFKKMKKNFRKNKINISPMEKFGNFTWNYLHRISAHYPVFPSLKHQKDMEEKNSIMTALILGVEFL